MTHNGEKEGHGLENKGLGVSKTQLNNNDVVFRQYVENLDINVKQAVAI
jgi:hypothetical protein